MPRKIPSNTDAIESFVDHWRDRESFTVAATGNCSFAAFITYEFADGEISAETTVTIIRNGYKEGMISLAEGPTLSAELFHLDFSRDYQNYSYRKSDHSLIVRGGSQKMRGDYRVVIIPCAP